MRTLTNQSGFHLLELTIVMAVLSAVSAIGWQVYTHDTTAMLQSNASTTAGTTAVHSVATFDTTSYPQNIWSYDDHSGSWIYTGSAPPACTEPFTIKTPVPLEKATGQLIPGQVRSSSYPGGPTTYMTTAGFRFDQSSHTDIQTISPIDGYVTAAANYTIDGEQQYGVEIIHPCGILIRLNHLRSLTQKFEKITEAINRTIDRVEYTDIDDVLIKAGEQISASTGLDISNTTLLEIGAYDLRNTNQSSENSSYAYAHARDKPYAWHAICVTELLESTDRALARKLPAADTEVGTTSDYCQ